jgi:two-component system response regulator GlrR
VIIVDDDRSFVDAMAIFLEDHGFDVTKAYSALEAIRALSRRRVDVAIIDVHLPDQEGTNVAHLLRQSQPFTPILLISSDDSDDTLAKCLKVQASAFMAKPLMPREILESVSRACDRVRTGQSLGPAAAARRSE